MGASRPPRNAGINDNLRDPKGYHPVTDRRTDSILRMGEVTRRTGLHRATIYRLVAAGAFPRKLQLSANCIGFYESDIADWIAAREAA